MGALGASRCEPTPEFDVKRLDVALNVLADGSIDVEERTDVHFGSTPASTFRRRVPVWHHDGVSAVAGWMDGREFPAGDGTGRLRVSAGPALDATWQFAPVSNSRHVFLLRYRAAGAVEVSGIRGTVSWRVLTDRHGSDAASTCVAVRIPAGAVLLENPGFEEAVGTSGGEYNGEPALCAVVSAPGALTRRVAFTIDTMAAAEPSWQYYEKRARDLMPAFVATALSLLAVGAGIVALVWFKYPPLRERPDPEDASELPPSLASALARGGPYGGELDALIQAGVVDRERVITARDLRRAGLATIAFGAVSWVFIARYLDYLGRWPSAIPVSILLCGVLFVASAPRLSILSQNGVNARARVLYSARVRDGRTSV